ncbi:MAG: CoA-binding protein [Rhodospirillales bacterium]
MIGAAAPLVYDDALLRRILRETRTIAMVGASPNWVRPSNFAMKYLLGKGYRVSPVNPVAAGTTIHGETVHARLADVPGPVQIVDIFRSGEAAGAATDEAIALAGPLGIAVVWMQLGVRNDAAARRAEAAGLTVILDRCIKIEYGRLFGELGWSGVNSGVISAKRPRLHP